MQAQSDPIKRQTLYKSPFCILVMLLKRLQYLVTSLNDRVNQGVTPNNELRTQSEASRSKVHSRIIKKITIFKNMF